MEASAQALLSPPPPPPPPPPPSQAATPPAAATSSPLYVSMAQSALARGLAALAALGADATEEQTAEALLQASLEIRTVAELECGDGGGALQLLTPPSPPQREALYSSRGDDGADEQRATTSVLRLFSQLESSDGELSMIRAQVRPRRKR
jgi:hypothetical protein